MTKGIPNRLRRDIWMTFSGAIFDLEAHPGTCFDNTDLTNQRKVVFNQKTKTTRTFFHVLAYIIPTQTFYNAQLDFKKRWQLG